MNYRTTPDQIGNTLPPNHVFVFGSNLAGKHGAGAALHAFKHFGARAYQGLGLHGQSYALPTKSSRLDTLPLGIIAFDVMQFIDFAVANKHLTFLVTEIGCGLAGYEPKHIAPMFQDALGVTNIHLPKSFWQVLEGNAKSLVSQA